MYAMDVNQKLANAVIGILAKDTTGRRMIEEGTADSQLHHLKIATFAQIRDLFLTDRSVSNSVSPLEEIESRVSEILFFNRRLAEAEMQGHQDHDSY